MLVLIGRNLVFIWKPDTSALTIGSFAITVAFLCLILKCDLGDRITSGQRTIIIIHPCVYHASPLCQANDLFTDFVNVIYTTKYTNVSKTIPASGLV